MKTRIVFIIVALLAVCYSCGKESGPTGPGYNEIEEIHTFGSPGVQYYIYSDGRTWDFKAENNMNIQQIEIKSVLASYGGTFHIQILIEGDVLASWDQYVSNTTYTSYTHSKDVTYTMYEGDTIQYKIWGGSFSNPVGGISGENYVKLIGILDE